MEKGKLPPNFNKWHLSDPDSGITLAHIAAWGNRLPRSFKQWTLAKKDGSTVAHEAAKWGNLPLNFKGWHLADNEGQTVAHVAARHGTLPPDFKDWHLEDANGVTVAEEFAKALLENKKQIPKEILKQRNKQGISVRDLLTKKALLNL